MSESLTVRQDTVTLRAGGGAVVVQQSAHDVVAAGVAGPAGSLSYCGAFSSSQTQPASAGSAVAMTFNTTEISLGVSVANSSQLVIASPGVWNIQFSAQLRKSTGGTEAISIWLRQNGTNVVDSAGDVQMEGNNTSVIASWNYVIRTTGINETVQFMWSSPSGHISLLAIPARTGPVRPAVPSVIATVTPVLVNPY